MGSLRNESEAILDMVADTRGFTSTKTHGVTKVVGPSGHSVSTIETDGPRAVKNLRTRLKNKVGWTQKLYEKQKEEDRRRRMERADQEHERRVARVDHQRTSLVVDDILGEIAVSSWALCEAVRERARQTGRPLEHEGIAGREWQGDVFEVARALWPELPDARNHPETIRLQTALIPFMQQAQDLLTLRTASNGSGATWWVRDEDDDRHDPPEEEGTPPPVEEPDPAPTASRSPEDGQNVKIYTCGEATEEPGVTCVFADTSPQSVAMHRTKYNGGPHPFEAELPCTFRSCQSVRVTVNSYAQHLARTHGFTGVVCRVCFEVLGTRSEHMSHMNREHPEHNEQSEQSPPTPVAVSEAPQSAVWAALMEHPEEAAKVIGAMLGTHATVVARCAQLEEDKATLRTQLATVEKTLRRIQRAMGSG